MKSEVSIATTNPTQPTSINNDNIPQTPTLAATSPPHHISIVSDSEHNNNNNNPTKTNPSTPSPSRRSNRISRPSIKMTDVQEAQTQQQPPPTVHASDEDNEVENKKPTKSGKSRRELPAGAVATLKAWLLSPEHFTHPYPTPQDQIMLMQQTGIDKKQLKNWFTNARRRIWKPMLKKQLEQGKMAQTGSGAVVALTPTTTVISTAPGTEYPTMTVDHSQIMQNNFQQALQQQQQSQNTHAQQQQQQQQPPQQYDNFGNAIYQTQQPQQHQHQPPTQQQTPNTQHPYNSTTTTTSYFQPNQFTNNTTTNQHNQHQHQHNQQQPNSMAQSNSIGSLPQMPGATPPGSMTNLSKTDSHAVLMELFTFYEILRTDKNPGH